MLTSRRLLPKEQFYVTSTSPINECSYDRGFVKKIPRFLVLGMLPLYEVLWVEQKSHRWDERNQKVKNEEERLALYHLRYAYGSN
jgi:hypothetical protein